MNNTLTEAERWKAIAINSIESCGLLEAKYGMQKDLADSYKNRLAEAEKDYEDLTEKFLALEREYNEVVKAGHVWRKSHSKIVDDRDGWKSFAVKLENAFEIENDALRKQLAVVTKQNNERLTLLQENGLSEYGN